jgi:hypothetical protein
VCGGGSGTPRGRERKARARRPARREQKTHQHNGGGDGFVEQLGRRRASRRGAGAVHVNAAHAHNQQHPRERQQNVDDPIAAAHGAWLGAGGRARGGGGRAMRCSRGATVKSGGGGGGQKGRLRTAGRPSRLRAQAATEIAPQMQPGASPAVQASCCCRCKEPRLAAVRGGRARALHRPQRRKGRPELPNAAGALHHKAPRVSGTTLQQEKQSSGP